MALQFPHVCRTRAADTARILLSQKQLFCCRTRTDALPLLPDWRNYHGATTLLVTELFNSRAGHLSRNCCNTPSSELQTASTFADLHCIPIANKSLAVHVSVPKMAVTRSHRPTVPIAANRLTTSDDLHILRLLLYGGLLLTE